MEREYAGLHTQAFDGPKSAAHQGNAAEREPHFEDLKQKIGNVQDLAAHLAEGLGALADNLFGGIPEPGEVNKLREVPCSGAVGDLFERISNLDDRLRCALGELDRLKRLV